MVELTEEQRASQQAAIARVRDARPPRTRGLPAWVILIAAPVLVALGLVLASVARNVDPPATDAGSTSVAAAKAESDARAKRLDRERIEFEEQAKLKAAETSAYKAAIAKLEDIKGRFGDAFAIASASSRMTMAAPLSQLQSIAREARSLDVPPCLAKAKGALVEGMDATVAGFLAFMRNEEGSEDVPGRLFDFASGKIDESQAASSACEPAAVPAP